MSNTGFYRVVKHYSFYRYEIKNKLVHKQISRKDILELKKAVEEQGFLWGIVDKEKANENKQIYNLQTLQGRYGIRVK